MATTAGTHLRRYPRHYGALVAFLLMAALVPVSDTVSNLALAGLDRLDGSTSNAPDTPDASAPGSDASSAEGAPPASPAGPSAGDDGDPSAPPAPDPTAGTAPAGDGLESAADDDRTPPPDESLFGLIPAPGGGSLLPPPPAIPLPTLPDELDPLLGILSPVTDPACSVLGLATVLGSLLGPAVEEIPLHEITPYLGPVLTACALLPPPTGTASLCPADEALRDAGYPPDVAGLLGTPNPMGIVLDTLLAVDVAVHAYTGQDPAFGSTIYDLLGCGPDGG